MKVTNGEIWRARVPLGQLLSKELPAAKTTYWLTKLVRKCNEHLRDIQPVHDSLVKKYGKASDDGKTIKVEPGSEGFAEFSAELDELMSQEVEIEGIKKVPLALEWDDNGVKRQLCLSGVQMMSLEPFCDIEVEEDNEA